MRTVRTTRDISFSSCVEKKKVTLDMKDRPARDVFQSIAQQAGVNIVVSNAIQDQITVKPAPRSGHPHQGQKGLTRAK